jgi:hypothetical protein
VENENNCIGNIVFRRISGISSMESRAVLRHLPMSTSETDEYKIGKCPCGRGAVTKTVVTQDNPWSGADVSYRIDCDSCRSDWELNRSGDRLTLRRSRVPSEQAGKVLMQARQNLNEYVRDLAAKHFNTLALRTKKAEHAHLSGLGILTGSYRTYLQDRKNSPMHRVAHPSRNSAFVDTLVTTFGDKAHYDSLSEAIADADAAYRTAAAKIVSESVKL